MIISGGSKATPRRGYIGIFNRSHYEDVLVVRVHNLVPEEVWRQRYEQINHFEKLLADTGTTILKFFLHIDRKEQKERLREVIRLRHYARSTEKTYLHWNRRFLAYRHETGAEGEPTAADAKAFLTHLAMVENVSASTQNQAFSALLLLFREVLRVDLEEMAQTVRAKRGPKLPTVLSVTYEDQGHGFFNHGRSGNRYYKLTLAETDKFLVELGWLPAK